MEPEGGENEVPRRFFFPLRKYQSGYLQPASLALHCVGYNVFGIQIRFHALLDFVAPAQKFYGPEHKGPSFPVPSQVRNEVSPLQQLTCK